MVLDLVEAHAMVQSEEVISFERSVYIQLCAYLAYPILTSGACLFLKEQLGCYWQQVVAVQSF